MEAEILWDQLWKPICWLILLSKVLLLHSAERMGEGAQPYAEASQPLTFPGVSFKLLTWQSDAKASFVHSLLQLEMFAQWVPCWWGKHKRYWHPAVLMISSSSQEGVKTHPKAQIEWRGQSMLYNMQYPDWEELKFDHLKTVIYIPLLTDTWTDSIA